ncbi:MAG TPA: ATP-binding cassette domain-containing protein [Pedobacter sp.]|uniref:ABC transporter ATP-binding protein n=1 Tax=Pedobacter sp. TaxID=1411316 RepID=UPI002CD555B6|nr:ATP-binding cassette domain-containing protein [Pedobacter sp.]HMI04914.1 ATP-binding cassette domain-containing protein [Pedobacter sp.]
MVINLENTGRRFNQEWIFRNLTHQFRPGGRYAVLGPNGSGKSTLLSIILGNLSPSEGRVSYTDGKQISAEDIYGHLSFAAPYLDLIEEFTLQETIDFHFKFKRFYAGLNQDAVLDVLGLAKSQDKALKYFSSGMKQRTKLVLACCTDSKILLLDEPTSNLDKEGMSWYHRLIENFTADKMIIVGSNQEEEYSFCNHFIRITDYK